MDTGGSHECVETGTLSDAARKAPIGVVPPPLSAFTPKERSILQPVRTPAAVQRFLNALPYNTEPGGETLREVQDRAWPALERIAATHAAADDAVVAVTHSFVISTSVCRAIGLPLANFRRVRAQVGSKTAIEIGEHGSALLALNDRSHLTGAGKDSP